jgi:hypothetical protein
MNSFLLLQWACAVPLPPHFARQNPAPTLPPPHPLPAPPNPNPLLQQQQQQHEREVLMKNVVFAMAVASTYLLVGDFLSNFVSISKLIKLIN